MKAFVASCVNVVESRKACDGCLDILDPPNNSMRGRTVPFGHVIVPCPCMSPSLNSPRYTWPLRKTAVPVPWYIPERCTRTAHRPTRCHTHAHTHAAKLYVSPPEPMFDVRVSHQLSRQDTEHTMRVDRRREAMWANDACVPYHVTSIRLDHLGR